MMMKNFTGEFSFALVHVVVTPSYLLASSSCVSAKEHAEARSD